MRNDALVIIDLDIVTVVVAGDNATLIPIGPSIGWPVIKHSSDIATIEIKKKIMLQSTPYLIRYCYLKGYSLRSLSQRWKPTSHLETVHILLFGQYLSQLDRPMCKIH